MVATWGGAFKDAVEKVIAAPFTAKTGIKVETDVGATLDRLAKARVNKANPQSDITLTTSHVARLYISDGLFEKLDMSRIPNSQQIFKQAVRSDYHLGLWTYVYTPAYRTDVIKQDITKWADLWNPSFKNSIAMPDFDPSHIIVISALMSGGNETDWQKGEQKLLQLKPNIKAFFQTDAQSQDLIKNNEAPIEIMLSINGVLLKDAGVPIKVVKTTDYGGVVGIDTMAVMKGSKNPDAAYQFINFALDKDIQSTLVKTLKAGPVRPDATVPSDLKDVPGFFATADQWKTDAVLIDDEVRAKNLNDWKDWFNKNIVAR